MLRLLLLSPLVLALPYPQLTVNVDAATTTVYDSTSDSSGVMVLSASAVQGGLDVQLQPTASTDPTVVIGQDPNAPTTWTTSDMSIQPFATSGPPAPTTLIATDTPVQSSAIGGTPTPITLTASDPLAQPLAFSAAPTTLTADNMKVQASTTSSVAPAASSTPAVNFSRPLIASYYAEYDSDKLKPEQIDYTLLDWVDFAFVVPLSTSTLQWSSDDSQDTLRRLVSYAHGNNTKVKVSVGGWSGSTAFSGIAKTDDGRRGLASSLADMYNTFNIDGIDMDWEFPGMPGSDSSHYDSSDTANYLLLLRAIRASLPPQAILTAAVSNSPFADANGKVSTDLHDFAAILDWILLMNYDVWGSSSSPGPNAPLADACGDSTQPDNNAAAGLRAWTQAGFAPSQIGLGVPSYGYVNPSGTSTLKHRRREVHKRFIVGTVDQAQFSTPSNSIPADGDKQVQFKDLLSGGFLQPNAGGNSSEPEFVGGNGFQRTWDGCSSTPFLRSDSAQQVVTYDDPDSLVLKAAFVKSNGLRGVYLYDLHGDTANWDLLKALRRGARQ